MEVSALIDINIKNIKVLKNKMNEMRVKFPKSKTIILIIVLLLLSFLTLMASSTFVDTTLKIKNKATPYALVAGGSKGIGYSIAEALAARHYNLILIARHENALISAKNKLESKYQIHVEYLVKDLSNEQTATEIAVWCIEHQIKLNVLCNVAGLGGLDDYLFIPLDTIQYMVRLNIESCIALSYTLLPLLEANAPSYILNVSSMAAFAPIPQKNVYSATKSAVLFFSYALHYQLKEKNISVSCLCPGPVFTKPSIEQDTKNKLGKFGEKMAVPVKTVGEIAIQKTLKGKMIIIPGVLPKIVATLLRILPKQFTALMYSKFKK
jgi:short-subunit dehydrogenase